MSRDMHYFVFRCYGYCSTEFSTLFKRRGPSDKFLRETKEKQYLLSHLKTTLASSLKVVVPQNMYEIEDDLVIMNHSGKYRDRENQVSSGHERIAQGSIMSLVENNTLPTGEEIDSEY